MLKLGKFYSFANYKILSIYCTIVLEMLNKKRFSLNKTLLSITSITSNVFHNYLFSLLDGYVIQNDLGASFTTIQRKKNTIIKKASLEGQNKLINEINWYLKFQNSKIKKWLPKIISYSLEKGNVYYQMKYYNYPNLRKIIMYNGNAFFVLKMRWKTIFNILLKYFYIKENSIICPPNFVEKCHFNKLKDRVVMIKKKAPDLKSIIENDLLIINKKKYLNYKLIINHIKKNKAIIKQLTPERLYYSHGDIHSNNILCGISPSTMILLDCRGKSSDGSDYFDVAYDIAKIFHDLRSLYSLIEKHFYSLFWQEKENNQKQKVVNIEYTFQGQEYIRRFHQNYRYVNKIIQNKMSSFKNIKYRAEFTEAMLYLTMVPMHLKNKSEGILCWVTGIQRLNQWFKKYHPQEYKKL